MLSLDEYVDMTRLTDFVEYDQFRKLLEEAEEEVDALTFHRISAMGFDTLSAFQQSRVKMAVARQADFHRQYGELLENPLATYSINGVSMSWDKSAIRTVAGIPTCSGVISCLMPTGLMYRGVMG